MQLGGSTDKKAHILRMSRHNIYTHMYKYTFNVRAQIFSFLCLKGFFLLSRVRLASWERNTEEVNIYIVDTGPDHPDHGANRDGGKTVHVVFQYLSWSLLHKEHEAISRDRGKSVHVVFKCLSWSLFYNEHEANIRDGGKTFTTSLNTYPEACCMKRWEWAE